MQHCLLIMQGTTKTLQACIHRGSNQVCFYASCTPLASHTCRMKSHARGKKNKNLELNL